MLYNDISQWRNWKDFLSTFFRPVKNRLKYKHFRFSSDFSLLKLGLCSSRSEWTLKKSSPWVNRFASVWGLAYSSATTPCRDDMGETTLPLQKCPMYVLLTRKISAPLRLKSRDTHSETVHCILYAWILCDAISSSYP